MERNMFINQLQTHTENKTPILTMLLKNKEKEIEELTDEEKYEVISYLKEEIAIKKLKLQSLKMQN